MKIFVLVLLALVAVASARWHWVEDNTGTFSSKTQSVFSAQALSVKTLADESFQRTHDELEGVLSLLLQLEQKLVIQLATLNNNVNSANNEHSNAANTANQANAKLAEAQTAYNTAKAAQDKAKGALDAANNERNSQSPSLQSEIRLIGSLKAIVGTQHGEKVNSINEIKIPGQNPPDVKQIYVNNWWVSQGKIWAHNVQIAPTQKETETNSPAGVWTKLADGKEAWSYGTGTRCGWLDVQGHYAFGWVWIPASGPVILKVATDDLSWVYVNGVQVYTGGCCGWVSVDISSNPALKRGQWNQFYGVDADGCSVGYIGLNVKSN